jgi:hypothetical protein
MTNPWITSSRPARVRTPFKTTKALLVDAMAAGSVFGISFDFVVPGKGDDDKITDQLLDWADFHALSIGGVTGHKSEFSAEARTEGDSLTGVEFAGAVFDLSKRFDNLLDGTASWTDTQEATTPPLTFATIRLSKLEKLNHIEA